MTDDLRNEVLNRVSGIAERYQQDFTPKKCNVYLYREHDSINPDGATTCELYIMPMYVQCTEPGVLHDGGSVNEYLRELTDNLPHQKIIFQCPRLISVMCLNGHDYTYHKINDEWRFMGASTTSDHDTVENLGPPHRQYCSGIAPNGANSS